MAVCRASADIESSDSDYCRQDFNDWSLSHHTTHIKPTQPVVTCNINNSIVNSININPQESRGLAHSAEGGISPIVKTFLAQFSSSGGSGSAGSKELSGSSRKKDDSLSDSQSDGQTTSHKAKGYHSDGTHASKLPPIGVFWDIENCQVPKGKSAVAVAQAIRNRFFNGYREAEFVIVCDVRKEHSTIIDELNDAQVNLIHVGSTSKNAADEKLRQSMRRFADIHGFPAAIILITGDINFAADINDLRHRKKIRVILLHNDCTSESLLLCASEHYHFYSLLEKLPMRGIIKAGMFPVVLSVNNLPVEYDIRRLKTRLKNLTGNCGGRVTHIQPPTAYIRFPSLTHAHRAQKRLEGECVFGNPISVGIPQRTPCDNIIFNAGNEVGGFMGGYPLAPPQAWLHPTNIFSVCSNNISSNDDYVKRSASASHCYPVCHHNESSLSDTLNSTSEDLCSDRNLDSSLHLHSRRSVDRLSGGLSDMKLEPSISSKLLALQGLCTDNNSRGACTDNSRRSLDNYYNKSNNQAPQYFNSRQNGGEKRRCRTPSPYTLMGKNQPVPPQPLQMYGGRGGADEAQVLNQASALQTNSSGPVELNISNLDYRFDANELKTTLMDMFSQHVPVVSLMLHRQNDGNIVASVKVNSVEDAQMAISKLHRAKLGYKRIIISYAHTPNPHHPHYLRHQIVSLLREVPGFKLPLFKFVEMFESRYLSTVSVSELHRLKDIVTVIEDSTGRILSLNTEHRNSPSPTPSLVEAFCSVHHRVEESCGWAELELNPLPRVSVHIAEFRSNLIRLVQSHNDTLPLASLHECYSAEISMLELVEDRGVPVEHLVTAVQSVELAVSNTAVKYLKPASNTLSADKEKTGMNEALQAQLQQFGREVVDLLRVQPQCHLSFHKFIPAYHHHFGRQCRVANYGYTKLIQLLEAIPNTVQVMGEGGKRVVTLSHRAQMKRFMIDTLRVLKSQPNKQAPLSQLSYLFEKTIGKSLDPVDYGLCYVSDLIGELPSSAVYISHRGSETILSIPNRNPPQSLHQQRIHEFTKEIEEVGDGEKKISLTLEERLRVVDNQVRQLVAVRYPPGLPLSSLPTAFLWQYGYALKPSAYNSDSLQSLVPKLTSVKIVDAEFGETLVPVDESMTCLLENQVRRMLMESPGGRMKLSTLKQKFNKSFHDRLTPPQIYSLLRDSIKVNRKEGGEEIVSLCGVDEEARRLYLILRDQPGGKLPLHFLEEAYRSTHGHSLPTHGYRSVIALLEAMSHTLCLRGKEPRKTVFLNRDLLSKTETSQEVPVQTPGILFNPSDYSHHPALDNQDEEDMNEGVMTSPARWPTMWSNGLTSEEFDNQVPMVNLPEMATPPAHIMEDSSLISPCKNLLPATLHPMLVNSPHPSQLPIPSQIYSSASTSDGANFSFNFDRKDAGSTGSSVVAGPSTTPLSNIPGPSNITTKRKLKMAAHFQNPLNN